MTPDDPSTHGPNGKDGKGRFAKGNKLGKGNPLAGRAAKIRAMLLRAATKGDVKAIADKLVAGAKGGDLAFIREWLDRVIGKPAQSDLLERIERLEEMLVARETEARTDGRN